MKEINRLIKIALEIAEFVELQGRNGERTLSDALGLGYLTLSAQLRRGVIEIINLQVKTSLLESKMEITKTSEQEARKVLEDIFGDTDIDCFSESEIAQLKNFVKSLNRLED